MPDGYAKGDELDPAKFPPAATWWDGAETLHIAGFGEENDINLWLPQGDQAVRSAFVVPIDDYLDVRLHNLRRAYRWLKGKPSGSPMRRERLSAFHRHRFVRMLRAIDGLRAGFSRREIASVLFSRDVRSLAAVDWRNTSERRQLARLITEANEYIEGGYLRILMGPPAKGHLFRGQPTSTGQGGQVAL